MITRILAKIYHYIKALIIRPVDRKLGYSGYLYSEQTQRRHAEIINTGLFKDWYEEAGRITYRLRWTKFYFTLFDIYFSGAPTGIWSEMKKVPWPVLDDQAEEYIYYASFEEILERVNDDIKTRLLFHLDLL